MTKTTNALKFILSDFGPLVAFFCMNRCYGLKPAIIVSIALSVLVVCALRLRRMEISALLKFSVFVTLVFGALDLTSSSPVFFKYEAALTNVFTGVFFGFTLFGQRKPLIQDFLEKMKPGEPMTAERAFSCRVLTVIWASYFFVKAGAYAWLAGSYSAEQALVLRATYGSLSLYILLGASLFLTRRVFAALRKARLLPQLAVE